MYLDVKRKKGFRSHRLINSHFKKNAILKKKIIIISVKNRMANLDLISMNRLSAERTITAVLQNKTIILNFNMVRRVKDYM